MALSFEESKKQLSQQGAATPMLMSLSAEPMLMSLSNDASSEIWEPDTKYAWFDSFVDDKISYIDDNKGLLIGNSNCVKFSYPPVFSLVSLFFCNCLGVTFNV